MEHEERQIRGSDVLADDHRLTRQPQDARVGKAQDPDRLERRCIDIRIALAEDGRRERDHGVLDPWHGDIT